MRVAGWIIIAGSALWIAAPFLVYPLLTRLLAACRQRRPARDPSWQPLVSVIVAARNEATVIRARIDNLLAQDWPASRLEVIVVSDASTDGTDEVVASMTSPCVRLLRCEARAGKTRAVHQAVSAARGEVLLFSDASTRWEPGCVRDLVLALSDPAVGCVSGRVLYDREERGLVRGFLLWQRFAVWLRRSEGLSGDLISVSGAIHGLRREHWLDLPASIDPDLALPAVAAAAERASVYVAEAVAWERPRAGVGVEFKARRRIAAHGMRAGAWAVRHAAATGAVGYLLRLALHKWLRWTAWLPALALLLAAGLGAAADPLLGGLFALQALFYLAGLAGLVLIRSSGRAGPLAVPAFWLLGNAALLAGLADVLRRKQGHVWEPVQG
jgi:cellulose synthase/poly-beta-1,6-N-acetylglucosamine synthase-like glycosyltransferase